MISPIVQVFVSVTSQISPSLMVERSASREKQIAVMLSENRHMFSQKDVDLLRMSEERVLRAQKLIPVAKSSVKVFTATRKYHNRVQEYYLEVQRVSTTARRRKLMRLDVPVHGGAGLAVLGQQLQGGEESEDDDDDSGDDDDPETPPPGLLKLKFEDVEVEAGTGASLELHYGDGHSIALLLNILPSGEVGYQTHPRTYSVSGIAELVPETAGACSDEGVPKLVTGTPKYRVQSITDLAITRVQHALDSGSESDKLCVDATTVVAARDGAGTSVLLTANGVTFSMSVDNGHDDNGDEPSIASPSLE